MERFTRAAAEALQLRNSPLFIADDRVKGWAWLPIDSDLDEPIHAVRQLAEATDKTVHLALGTVDAGVDGLRRSHRRARDARRVAAAAPSSPRTRRWVIDTLGPLASDTANDARLRETLREFLREGSSDNAAAEHLMLRPNSGRYRVTRAVERRGRPIDLHPDRRPQGRRPDPPR